MKVQDRLMQALFIEIPQVLQKKMLDTFLTDLVYFTFFWLIMTAVPVDTVSVCLS